MFRYFSLKLFITSKLSTFLSFLYILVKSEINSLLVTYNTALSKLLAIWFPIACIKWVLPSPLLPYINKGLYILPGFSATAWADEQANLFVSPTIKLSKV